MSSPLRPAVDLLAQYAEYHRDRRNIATHLIGVPLIVFGLAVLLAGARFGLAGSAVSAADLAFVVIALWMLTRGEFVDRQRTCSGEIGVLSSSIGTSLIAAADRVNTGRLPLTGEIGVSLLLDMAVLNCAI